MPRPTLETWGGGAGAPMANLAAPPLGESTIYSNVSVGVTEALVGVTQQGEDPGWASQLLHCQRSSRRLAMMAQAHEQDLVCLRVSLLGPDQPDQDWQSPFSSLVQLQQPKSPKVQFEQQEVAHFPARPARPRLQVAEDPCGPAIAVVSADMDAGAGSVPPVCGLPTDGSVPPVPGSPAHGSATSRTLSKQIQEIMVNMHQQSVRQSAVGRQSSEDSCDVSQLEGRPRLHNFWKSAEKGMDTIRKHDSIRKLGTSADMPGQGDERPCCLIIQPTTGRRMAWDLFSTLAITYDLLVLPLDAFEFSMLPFAKRASFCLTCFWTLDLVISFLSGYHRHDGTIELRWRNIAKRYLKTWFPFDLFILLLDWTLFFGNILIEELVSAGRLQKAVRFFRAGKLLRLVRLVRVVKLAALYEELCEFIFSSNLVTVLNVVRMLVGLSVFVHYISCGWYLVGVATYRQHQSWLSPWVDEAPSYLYVVSFHWTLAQFLPAPCKEHPQNRYEYIFTLGTLMMGFVLFSSVIGGITAMITQSRQAAYRDMRQKELLRRFFTDNSVDAILGNRIMHFLSQAGQKKHKVGEADVDSLKLLPDTLRMELHFQVHSQILFEHAFFELLDDVRHPAMMQLCETAVTESTFLQDDEIFHHGTAGTCMRFVVSGQFTYYFGLVAFDEGAEGQLLAAGEHLSEAVIWSQWLHRGLIRANESSSRVFCVHAEHFKNIVSRHPSAYVFCTEYAALFLERLTARLDDEEQVDDRFSAFESRLELCNAAHHRGMESLPPISRGWRRFGTGMAPGVSNMADSVSFRMFKQEEAEPRRRSSSDSS